MDMEKSGFRLDIKGIAMMLSVAISVLACSVVRAQSVPTSDEINDFVLLSGSIIPTWTQPEENPWTLSFINNSDYTIESDSRADLQFSFRCEKPVILQYHVIKGYVKCIETKADELITLADSNKQGEFRVKLDPGEHNMCIQPTSLGASFKDFGIFEYHPENDLSQAIYSEFNGLEIINDNDHPWYGYIDKSNNTVIRTSSEESGSTSSLILKFNNDKAAELKCSLKINNQDLSYGNKLILDIIINEKYLESYEYSNGEEFSEIIYQGDNVVELRIRSEYVNTNMTSIPISCLNIENLSVADLMNNSMSVEIQQDNLIEQVISELTNHGYSNIQEIDKLSISGTIGEADWKNLKLLKNLRILDISQTNTDIIPDSAFSRSKIEYLNMPASVRRVGAYSFEGSQIRYINLPDGLEEIGGCAFGNTSKLSDLKIPSTVANIGRLCFSGSNIRDVNFAEDSRLNTIGWMAFGNCRNLTTITLPESLISISDAAFRESGLTNIELPNKLENLGGGLFVGCNDLKTVVFPTGIYGVGGSMFDNCESLERIILPCATPPLINSGQDFTGDSDKSKIILEVPNYATEHYRKDSYWGQFPNITSSDKSSNLAYWKIVGTLTLEEGERFQGTPEVEIMDVSDINFDYISKSLTINGQNPLNIGSLKLHLGRSYNNRSYDKSISVINNCSDISVSEISIEIKVPRESWYFICPPFDINISDIEFKGIDQYVFRYYDAEYRALHGTADNSTGKIWKNVTDGVLKAGQAYIFMCKGMLDCSMILKGDASKAYQALDPTERNIELSDIAAKKGADANWNFIGNPYPSYFDIKYLDIGAPITVKDGQTNSYIALSAMDDDYLLQPLEGFFVQKPVENTKGATFSLGGRVTSEINFNRQNIMGRCNSDDCKKRKVFNVEIFDAEENYSDRTRVVINEESSLGYEMSCDASKFMADNESTAQIYTVDEWGNKLAINERPLADGYVNLDIEAGSSDEYTVRATRMEGDIYLIDNETGDVYNLAKEDYTLKCEPNSKIYGRFQLLLNQDANEVAYYEESKPEIKVSNGQIDISNPSRKQIFLYSSDGKLYYTSESNSISLTIAPGIYILRCSERVYKLMVK